MRFSAVCHITKCQTAAAPHMGADGCIIILSITSRTLRIMSVATKHTGHDRFIASCGAIPSQISPPLFTELRTSRMTLRAHVGVSEFLLPVTPGQAGSAPAKSSIEFRSFIESALFYCVFLRRLSRNKAHKRELFDPVPGVELHLLGCAVNDVLVIHKNFFDEIRSGL